MIAKKDLKPGMYYKGICRGTYVAFWCERLDCFIHIDWNMGGGPYTEKIKHIEDVKETRTDGFVPVEEIPPLDRETYQKERAESGY